MGNELSSELPEDWATVDMVNRHTFCPRLCHLMYVEGRWEDNVHTLAGKDVHRRVDRIANLLPEALEQKIDAPEDPAADTSGDDPPVIARSVSLGCEVLGLMGKLDLVAADPEGGEAVPVETKKSRVPNTPERSYPPERAQLMAQGLLLRAHGYTSTHGYISHGQGIRNAYNRSAQYAAATDPARCLTFAKELVRAKIANQRILIQRNGTGPAAESALLSLTRQLKDFPHQPFADLYQLLGCEGQAAATYFSAFSSLLKTGELGDFHFTSRNRRPPKDPVNALLSFCYALLAKECSVALMAEGLDPWWGFYHQARHGRPALALDLMEAFRPLVADSVVITAINTGMVKGRDFVTNANGCALQPKGKKALLQAWEQRLDQLYTHPLFDYRCSWRTIIKIQARLLARWLRGDIPTFTCPVVR
jgi:CRISPR-associated endonuclease Cas1